MTIKDIAQTSFLVCGVITIFLFGFIYYLMMNESVSSIALIKDSINLTASFFGGIATLVAAYIATLLFNDWKDQEKYKIHLKFIECVANDSLVLITELRKIAYPTSKIKNAIKIYKKDDKNTEFTVEKIRALIDENYEANLFMAKYFKAVRYSIDRYSKFSKDTSLNLYKNLIILEYSNYAQYKSVYINDIDKPLDEIQSDAEDLINLIIKFTNSIEEKLIPLLDEMNSPDYWKKIKQEK
ncbi:hypothetical protein [Acinetobacter baumannii]|uniref:hypothetical protein n=1 Tax=Acinetobacter baumannii TaxID=470 RepID=UPI00135F5637|nr:hypothetical protein [Acinetobacter baumannii]MDC5408590.1 hypothetical protein [Acinetobacter baumannii]CAA0187961.1 hypothetical protein AB571B5_01133 [Acinetobacter baumannii]